MENENESMAARLVEAIDLSGVTFVEENGVSVIRDVCLLGSQSKNGYEYDFLGMHAAVDEGLYADVPVYLNHAAGSGARDLMHLAGQVQNAKFEDNRVKGDIRVLPDVYGRKILDIARLMPRVAGFSHVANGRLVQRAGKRVVEKIEKVFSVDCVSSPATTNSIYEGQVIEGDIPRPFVGENGQPREKQYEFVARCISTVKAGNATLTDEQASAICFTAWQARFESDGMDSGSAPVAPTPPARETQTEIITMDPESTRERNDDMNSLDKLADQFEQMDKTIEAAAALGTLNPTRVGMVIKVANEERLAEFERRRTQHAQDTKTIEQAATCVFQPHGPEEIQTNAKEKVYRVLRERKHITDQAVEITDGLALETARLIG